MSDLNRPHPTNGLRAVFILTSVLAGLCVLVTGSLDSLAQRRPLRSVGTGSGAAKTPGKTKQQTPEKQQLRFGQASIFGYTDADADFGGGTASATGPNTTVDLIDPKQPNVKVRLQASKIVVYWVRKDKAVTGEVDRVEMIGNVRFNSVRPATTGGTQTLRGSGSKGTYFKTQGKMEIEGPVSFYGEQPSADGMAKQSVNGRSERATYDEKDQLLKLLGEVKVILALPGTLDEPTPFYGDEITVEMEKRPYKFSVHNKAPATEPIVIKPSQPPAKKKP